MTPLHTLGRALRSAVTASLLVAIAAFALAVAAPSHADEYPRFQSLKSGLANLRVGPGQRYPIDWVYKRRGLPLLVTAAFDQWRRVSDHEGTSGWVHHSLLSPRRTVLIMGDMQTIRLRPALDAPPILRAEAGVIAELLECEGQWCQVSLVEETGWVHRGAIWGAEVPAP
jgi:SH3-like domain-containing protein